MRLSITERLMREKAEREEFDSYAVYVKSGDRTCCLFSDNVNGDTYFDIASCGKILVTTPLVLQAVTQGRLSLDTTLAELFRPVPEDKRQITVRQLLSHTSGIVRHQYTGRGKEQIREEILNRPLAFAPGTNEQYSCSGMVLLGFALEGIYGEPLEMLFERNLKKPLGYTRSKFNIAKDEENAAVCYRYESAEGLPTPWDDENIRVLGTSAGSGGQFFTLSDIILYTNAVLNRDERLYAGALFDLAEARHSPDCAAVSRGLGWLYVDEAYKQTGKLFPVGSFGHCGHSGQSIFFNREKELCVVILTNATRFLNKRSNYRGYDYSVICQMREQIHNAICQDLSGQREAPEKTKYVITK